MPELALILLVGLLAAGVYFYRRRARLIAGDRMPGQLRAGAGLGSERKLQNVRAGGVLHLAAVGPDLEDFDVTVRARHEYQQGTSRWYELECDRGDATVWIDFEQDDGLEIAVALRKLKMRDLGNDKRDLERMDEHEDGKLSFEGRTYHLDDSDRANFHRGGQPEAESLYYWDFEDDDGRRFLGIERWDDGSYDVTYSESVTAEQVTVYSVSGDAPE